MTTSKIQSPEEIPQINPGFDILSRLKKFYHENEPLCTITFFVAGFLFDTLAVGRIDKIHNIIHQASYLTLCALFTGWELLELYGGFTPPDRFKTAWKYHTGATHFMLGTLLNIYTLFYFKSASLWTSFVFMVFLVGLLGVNELKPFKHSGTTLRLTLFSLCLVSYFTYLVPMLAGSIGVFPFIGSLFVSSVCSGGLAYWLSRKLPAARNKILQHILIPYACVAAGFAGLYFAKILPPVPLSLSEIGIYHNARREGGDFVLTRTRSPWRFWERGDQTFLARPGDSVYCYVSVFSPTRFKEKIQVVWLHRTPSQWLSADAIPLAITGGRGGGWRGFTEKAHWEAGHWRVRIETSDKRELGRIDFDLKPDSSTGPRTEKEFIR